MQDMYKNIESPIYNFSLYLLLKTYSLSYTSLYCKNVRDCT